MHKTILQFFENEFQNIVRTHKIDSHFNRYDSLPLFKSIINEYQKKYTLVKELISSALYTSDYIIMSSEVRQELDDENSQLYNFIRNKKEKGNWEFNRKSMLEYCYILRRRKQ